MTDPLDGAICYILFERPLFHVFISSLLSVMESCKVGVILLYMTLVWNRFEACRACKIYTVSQPSFVLTGAD